MRNCEQCKKKNSVIKINKTDEVCTICGCLDEQAGVSNILQRLTGGSSETSGVQCGEVQEEGEWPDSVLRRWRATPGEWARLTKLYGGQQCDVGQVRQPTDQRERSFRSWPIDFDLSKDAPPERQRGVEGVKPDAQTVEALRKVEKVWKGNIHLNPDDPENYISFA